MKFLKIKSLFVFCFLSLYSLADDLLIWKGAVCSTSRNLTNMYIPYVPASFSSKEDAVNAALKYIPVTIRSSSFINKVSDLQSLVDLLNTSVYSFSTPNYNIGLFNSLSDYQSPAVISNIVTHESIDIFTLINESGRSAFIKNAITTVVSRYNNNIKLFDVNNVVRYVIYISESDEKSLLVIIDYDSFCNNVINGFKNLDINVIKENIEYLFPYLISQFNNISNSFDRVITNSDNGISLLHNIDSNVSSFSYHLDDIIANTSMGKIQAIASGTVQDLHFGMPDSSAQGPLLALYQLIRNERGEPENLNPTQREAYNYLGLDKQFGTWPSSQDFVRISQTLAAQVVAKTAAQEKKYQDLFSIADDDGFVTDPDTGEKVSLQDAFKNWNNQKSQGALAAYSYNNPSATNGFFGALKRSLTEESDWRLLDKNFKNKMEQFTDDVKEDGIKIKNGNSPLRVAVQQDVPISVDISKESFDGVVISTDSKQDIQLFRGAFNSFFELWQVYSGVNDKSSRSWLDLINESNSNYYDFVREKLFVTLSNDLASIVRNTSRTNDFYNSLSNQLERIIAAHDVTVASTSPFEIYVNQNVSTLNHIIPDAYLLHDERYQSFEGSTNFEQAIIFMLHDQHVIAQNNLKANMMTADYIRGIYHSLYSGSNIAERVDYITNQVFSANSLSTDPDHDYSSAYASQADELKTHLNDIVTSITEFKTQTLEKLTPIANQIFADYILPSKLTLLNFRGNKFEVDLIKYRTIFDLMHYASSVAWLIIGLLMLPRVIYMLLAFSLKILGKFYNIMRNG